MQLREPWRRDITERYGPRHHPARTLLDNANRLTDKQPARAVNTWASPATYRPPTPPN